MSSESESSLANLSAVDVASLRAKWERLAGEVGRDLAKDHDVAVPRSMERLADLQTYIALVERHRHAKRPKWRRWDFWRRVILALAVCTTAALLFMAFTHPANIEARLDLHASSITFDVNEEVRLAIGRRFETLTATGLDRAELPSASGQRIVSQRDLTVSSDRVSGGRLDWVRIPAGSTVQLRSAGRELSVRVNTTNGSNSTGEADALPGVRFAMNSGGRVNLSSADGALSENDVALGSSDTVSIIEGLCAGSPGRLEVSITLAMEEMAQSPLRFSRLSGVNISRLSCSIDNEATARSESTLLRGEVSFPDIEVPPAVLDEATTLAVVGLRGSIVRVEASAEGVRLVCGGMVHDIRGGADGDRSLLPSRLEHLFARRFRMYVTGVLLYALVFIIALLKGEKASIGEGFQPRSLMKMVHGGGHL